MQMHNSEIATILNKLADLLEIEGENPFRIRAYRTAARVISNLSKNLSDLVAEEADLTEIPGIGERIAEKIKIIVKTHNLPQLKEVEAHTPAVLSELMRIEGLGPKRVKMLYQKLHIQSTKDLKTAIEKGKVQKLKGFGEKIQQKINEGILHVSEYEKHYKLCDVIPIVDSLCKYLKSAKNVKTAECAGSYRRRKEMVGDLDFLVTATKNSDVIEKFTQYDEVQEVVSKGPTRSTVRLRSGIQADLRVVPQISYGAALLYFTGSKPHNIHIRKIALKKGLKINEYGVFKDEKRVTGKTEAEIYKKIGLEYIDPELREDRGEIEAAQKKSLPKLIEINQIRGDLHCHTNMTDGHDTLETMIQGAKERKYEYLAITDHSKHLAMTRGFDEKKLLQQIKKIDRLNEKLKGIVILKSIEVDILEDGSLDLSDDILKELDVVVGSVHSKFNLSTKKQTERILKAMDNPYFNILGHPTGRLINKREPYEANFERIIKGAKDRGCILEINAQPERLDFNDLHCQIAKSYGVKLSISTDSHSLPELDFMKFGVYQARRGWLEAKDVINTRNLKDLKKLLKKL